MIVIKVTARGRSHIDAEVARCIEARRTFDPHQAVTARRGKHCPTAHPIRSWRRDYSLTEKPKLRFAVGTFDSWAQVRNALHDLRMRGLVLDSFNCLALERLFAGKTIVAPDREPVTVEALRFAESAEPIACTSGPLADCLLERIDSGAQSLKDALGRWLIPRHAAYFLDAVEAGKILFWIKVADADDERIACQSLLAHSSNSVGVHDLMLPGEQ